MLPLDAWAISTEPHAMSVETWCRLVAAELGLEPAHVDRIALAGRLHDVGKAHIPRAILDKPGPLDEREWRIVRRHPELGARLLADPAYDDVRPWVLLHHERPDGQGYPFGVKGADLPLEAAIIAVSDAWSAMTSDRAYRPAMRSHKVAAELRAGAGTRWDRRCVEALIRVHERALGLFRPPAPGDEQRQRHAAAHARPAA